MTLSDIQQAEPDITGVINVNNSKESAITDTATVNILGIPISPVTISDVVKKVEQVIYSGSGEKLRVTTPNPEFIVESIKNEQFAKALGSADISMADGSGIIWASYYLRLPWRGCIYGIWQLLYSGLSLIFYPRLCYRYLPARATGVDLSLQLAETAAARGWRLFLLGAREGVGKRAKLVLERLYPGAQIAGTYAGSPAPEESDKITRLIDESKAEILLVSFNAPKQDIWIAEHMPKLKYVKVGIGVGGTLDFISGEIKRAPSFLRYLHLEWLWRLLRQPKRFVRIIKATLYFTYLVCKKRFRNAKNASRD